MLDWNDLRYFLAVARTGSTLAAAKHLRVSQSTISRRVTALEDEIGVKLFIRKASGYSLTPRGKSVLPAAESVEAAALSFSDSIAAEARRIAGTVRLTTVESAANAWIIPTLGLLRARYPDLRVEIMTSDRNLDLLRGEADVALRFGEKPTEETLIVRHLIDMQETFYAHQNLVAELGMPDDLAEIARYPLIMPMERDGTINRWLIENFSDAKIAHRANTLSSIIASVRSGVGASILPCLMGDDTRGLVRLLPPIAELTTPGWMVTTDDARRQPHIRALIDFVVEQIQLSVARSPAHLAVVQAA
ncbi:LysR family transcriptional regulator [Parasphingorhabdus sp.]|uniref:LysR family transcriptional regulator n=1 Tax=Parasphingorhabdus sp. TaxID=2709688 RepID=UPI003C7310F4